MASDSAVGGVGGRLARPGRLVAPHVARALGSHWGALGVLAVVAVSLGVAAAHKPAWFPPLALVAPLVLGGWVLRIRSLVVLCALVGLTLAYVDAHPQPHRPVDPGEWLLVGLIAALMLLLARSRSLFGVRSLHTGSMLFDLRDRLRAQGEMPPLPRGWQAEIVRRSAGGASFGGDFLVASRSPDARLLEVAIVDVSGKGMAAGTRALLLSGAFGGLLGAMPSDAFLAAANSYLLRQHWDEGFATAAHVVIDLQTGDYRVTNAGHPPAVQFHAGSGRWRTVEAFDGPLLGVIPDAVYVGEKGRLERGDALLLYTDGLIETPGRDLSVGIDRLLGEAERLVPGGFRDGARRLVDGVATGENDDRALLLLWRE
jgi:hypothetical protein